MGGQVVVAMRDQRHNDTFAQKLRILKARYPTRLGYGMAADVHQKCLCGEGFALRGSMNFTHNGLNAKEEQMTLTVDSAQVHTLRFALADRWSYLLEAGVGT